MQDPIIISIRELLSKKKITIPEYQRPYKWTVENVYQLFTDIQQFSVKSKYRLGTIVFQQDNDSSCLNIVDGQQRVITLSLILHAINTHRKEDLQSILKPFEKEHKVQFYDVEELLKQTFSSDISKINITNNYQEIVRIVKKSDFRKEDIDFLFNKCEVVTFTLEDISEAFQFFDSQNARGKDLEPHDLLKAYHLREFSSKEKNKEQVIESWEKSAETESLSLLFANYLFRIRNWSKGKQARYFTKSDISLFKGVNLETINRYPYAEQLRLINHFVNQYNQNFDREFDGNYITFPFNLDQTVVNGKRFFEMIEHYHKIFNKYQKREILSVENTLSENAQNILTTLDKYLERCRTGDQYVRMMFDCLYLYYVDKFGNEDLSQAIEKIFIWAYSLRIESARVYLASVDNYVLEKNLFARLKDAIRPHDFLSYTPISVDWNDEEKLKDIKKLFKEMGYGDKRG